MIHSVCDLLLFFYFCMYALYFLKHVKKHIYLLYTRYIFIEFNTVHDIVSDEKYEFYQTVFNNVSHRGTGDAFLQEFIFKLKNKIGMTESQLKTVFNRMDAQHQDVIRGHEFAGYCCGTENDKELTILHDLFVESIEAVEWEHIDNPVIYRSMFLL